MTKCDAFASSFCLTLPVSSPAGKKRSFASGATRRHPRDERTRIRVSDRRMAYREQNRGISSGAHDSSPFFFFSPSAPPPPSAQASCLGRRFSAAREVDTSPHHLVLPCPRVDDTQRLMSQRHGRPACLDSVVEAFPTLRSPGPISGCMSSVHPLQPKVASTQSIPLARAGPHDPRLVCP